ncbi:CHAT domain-containing protein, partial [Candidatus Neomarinimicrobiota bacterium]
ILSYLPFESLLDENDNYLVDNYTVRYVQSLKTFDYLQSKQKLNYQKDVLAIGGALYNNKMQEELAIDKRTISYIERGLSDSSNSIGIMGKSYDYLGLGSWNNIPGSLLEVNMVSDLFSNSSTLIGANAYETNFKQLSSKGDLSSYKIIHFATHGIVIPDIPDLTAIVFSQVDKGQIDDGYLTVKEIEILNIKTELVNLSACNSGIGKVYDGEGVVGLVQAFMVAGADAVSSTLWPISDDATAIFMESYYRKIFDGKPYDVALANTKQEFIHGIYGEEYENPYYWASYVYYGK